MIGSMSADCPYRWDWQDGFGARGDGGFDLGWIHGEGTRESPQDWSGSGVENRGDTGHEGEGDRYDFIAGTFTRSQESQVQRAGPGVYGNTLGGSCNKPRNFFRSRRRPVPELEPTTVKNPSQSASSISCSNVLVLGFEIEVRNFPRLP